jgi:hypothetical protein
LTKKRKLLYVKYLNKLIIDKKRKLLYVKSVIAMFIIAFFNVVLGHGGTPGFAGHHLSNTGLKWFSGVKKVLG